MYSSFIQVSAAASLPGGEILGSDLIRIVTRTGGSGCLEAIRMALAPLSGVANLVLHQPQSSRGFCPTGETFSSVSQRPFVYDRYDKELK